MNGVRHWLPTVCLALFAIVGVIGATGFASVADDHIRAMLVDQVAARAADQVSIGVTQRTTAVDFEPPFTSARLDTLSARLDPLLARARQDGSGLLRVELIARDGTVLYSDLASRRGQVVSPLGDPLLAHALAGTRGAVFRSLQPPGDDDGLGWTGAAALAEIPIAFDGKIVGVYVLYQELHGVQVIEPAVAGLATATLAVVLLLLYRRGRGVSKPNILLAVGPEWHRANGSNGSNGSNGANGASRLNGSTASNGSLPVVTNTSERPDGGPVVESPLTAREHEVLRLLADDCTYRDIAAKLVIGEETVRTHVKNILRKLGQPDRVRAVRAAHREHLI
jgi:DNA-binding CsgD family transcriptional regulator